MSVTLVVIKYCNIIRNFIFSKLLYSVGILGKIWIPLIEMAMNEVCSQESQNLYSM